MFTPRQITNHLLWPGILLSEQNWGPVKKKEQGLSTEWEALVPAILPY